MKKFIYKRFLAVVILACGFAVAAIITHAQTSSGSSSVTLKKDSDTGFFLLTIKASAGIKEFAFYPPGKSPYGGGMNCQAIYKNELVTFADPADFTPKMEATVTECNGKSTDFELLPSKNGLIVGKRVLPPAETPTSASPPAPSEAKEEPKSQILTNVKFPVPELGNCQSETECVSYCDDVSRAKVCLEFAKKNNILPADEIEKREKLVDITDGPGGCNSQKSCEDYCGDISRLDECFSFAEKHNLLSDPDRKKIEKLKTAINGGAKLPGGCNNQKSCESYCNNADHSDECLAFGEQSGFLDAQEIKQYRKFAELRKSGETPGNCSSKESCEAYCNQPDNAEECLSFAEKAGFLSGDELEQAKKMLPLIKEGKTPGGCRTKQQCEAYCSDDTHTDECITFGLQAGVISQQDAEIIKKTGGKGPGGCRGKEQCQTYCEQNQQECASWAKENGLEGQFSGPGGCKSQEECMAYCKDNPEECKNFSPPGGGSNGGFPIGPGGGPNGPGGGGSFGGLGGCKSQEECTAYCKDHPDECGGGGGGGGGTGGGPGGCQNAEECTAYCTAHYTDPACASYIGGGGGGTGGGSQGCVPPPSGLITGWNGEGVSGTVVPNIDNTRNGTISGGVTIVLGKVGNAFKFDGSSGYINMNNPGNLNFGTGPFSLEAWFNWDGGGSSVNNIIRKSNYPGSGPGSGYWVRIGRDAQIIEFSIGATTGPEGQSIITAPITSGVWHHVAATRDSSDTINLYIDGESKGTVFRKASGANSTSESSFALGAWDDQRSEYFSGLIDEVSVYNRALGASEVQAIFNAGGAGKCSAQSQSSPQISPPSSRTPQDYCSSFASVPNCSYVGSPDSNNYKYCKQCFPDK